MMAERRSFSWSAVRVLLCESASVKSSSGSNAATPMVEGPFLAISSVSRFG